MRAAFASCTKALAFERLADTASFACPCWTPRASWSITCSGRRLRCRGRPRFAMLETVREFAAERLAKLRRFGGARRAFAALVKDLARPPLWPDGLDRSTRA